MSKFYREMILNNANKLFQLVEICPNCCTKVACGCPGPTKIAECGFIKALTQQIQANINSPNPVCLCLMKGPQPQKVEARNCPMCATVLDWSSHNAACPNCSYKAPMPGPKQLEQPKLITAAGEGPQTWGNDRRQFNSSSNEVIFKTIFFLETCF